MNNKNMGRKKKSISILKKSLIPWMIVLCLLMCGCTSKKEEYLRRIEELESTVTELEGKVTALEGENSQMLENISSLTDENSRLKEEAEKMAAEESMDSESEPEEEPEPEPDPSIGIFSSVDTADGLNQDVVSYEIKTSAENTTTFQFLKDMTITADEKKIVAEYELEWVSFQVIYEIDETITDAAGCEEKIRSITAEFPEQVDEKGSVYLIEGFEYYLKGFYDTEQNLDDVWFVSTNDQGAYYFHEQSTHETADDVLFSLLRSESYLCYDGITIHKTVEVSRYDFMQYYNSKESTIDKNDADTEYWRMMSDIETFDHYMSRCIPKYAVR